jgi:aspartyl-tRNA(Asn)/glutamyl-tRNA(Gln) amidotransferase subunit C
MITKKELEHLGELARLDLSGADEEKLLGDLQKILEHFEELKNVKTDNVEPMAGGTFTENVFRADDSKETELSRERVVEQFPEKEKGYLKIPPVF